MKPSAPCALPRPIRILSDDLTGALDTAAMLAGRGPIPVHLDRPAARDDAPVSVVSTGTRDVDPATLAPRLAPSLRWLREAAVPFRKVDSLLRGNALVEVVATARGAGFGRVLFAPAFPAQGRFTVGARLLLGAPYGPDEASAAPGPGPLDAAFAALGADTLAGAAALEALEALVRTGPDEARAQAGPLVLIPDVRTDADLEALVERALALKDGLLWCGSAGLAQGIAYLDGAPTAQRSPAEPSAALPAAAPADPPAAAPIATPAGPPADRPAGRGLLVTASRHDALRGQLARLRALGEDAAIDVVDLAAADPMPPEAAAEQLARGVARRVAEHERPAWLAVVGGDTLLALCRAAGVEALCAGPAPRPGWGRATLVGGAWHGLTCHSRSGAFGASDDLLWLARAARPGP